MSRAGTCIVLTIVALCGWAAVGAVAAAGAEPFVEQAVFARGVQAREPVEVAQSFPRDVGQIYFFTRIVGMPAAAEVRHVWIYDGKELANVALHVGGAPWRTWSSKRILPAWVGDWSVEVRDASGRVLATGTCRVE
jgi:hypothetical protein